MTDKMFWALKVEPGKKYTQQVEESFHVSHAAMELSKSVVDSMAKSGSASVTSVYVDDGSGEEYVLCNLTYPQALNQTLDLNFIRGESVVFRIETYGQIKSAAVHLTGYLVPAADEDDDDSVMESPIFKGMLNGEKRVSEVDSDDEDQEDDGQEDDDDESETEDVDSKNETGSLAANKKRKAETDAREILNAKRAKSNEKGENKDVKKTSNKVAELTNGDGKHDLSSEGAEDEEDDDDDSEVDEEHEEIDSNDEDEDDDDEEEDDDVDDDEEEEDEDEEMENEKDSSIEEVAVAKSVKSNKKEANKKSNGHLTPLVNGQKKLTKQPMPNSASIDQKENRTPNRPESAKPSAPSTPTGTAKDVPQKKTPKRVIKGGIIVEDLVFGSGTACAAGKQVGVYYEGKLKSNDKTFDSQLSGKPMKFKLGSGQVIKGWDLGIEGMKVGGKRRLTIPPKMAYGAAGAGSDIPPNATLVFDVEAKTVN